MTDELPRSPAAVRRTYEQIAVDFDRTRQSAWPAVETFVQTAAAGGVGLDIGCGNGRHCALLGDCCDVVYGMDLSRSMLEMALMRYGSSQVGYLEGSATAIPLPATSVDVGLYIATIHHLPDRDSRVESLDEVQRVLTSDGRALISAWSIDHDRFTYDDPTDTIVEWTLSSGAVVDRFYHLYDIDSFDAELADSRLEVERSWLEAGNCYAIVQAAEK